MYVRALVEQLAVEQAGLLSARDLKQLGLSRDRIRTAVRKGILLRRGRGLYALPETPLDPDLHEKALALDGVISHDTAAALWGLELAHSPDQQHLTVNRSRKVRRDAVPGWRVHRSELSCDEIVRMSGLRVTSALRTVLDCARTLPLPAAVAIGDSALRNRLVQLADLQAAVAAMPPGPGRSRVQQVIALLDAKSGSVLESLLRILLWENGLLPPETQFEFRNASGSWIGFFDFAWPRLRLIIEADGFEFHSRREDLRRDCRRHNAVTRCGWWLLRFTWEDVVLFPDEVIAVVRETIIELAPEVAADQEGGANVRPVRAS